MSFFDKALKFGEEAIKAAGNELEKKNAEYESRYLRYSDWASGQTDERLKATFKSASNSIQRKAMYDELVSRGYTPNKNT